MAEVVISGVVGVTYTLQHSTNLISWTDGASAAGTSVH
jgi:hypothetical protein